KAISEPSWLALFAYATYTLPSGPTANPGKLCTRSLPTMKSIGKKSEAFSGTDDAHDTPLFVDVATRVFERPVVRDTVAQATWTLLEPLPANRGIEPVSNVGEPGFRMTPADHAGGVPVMMLSENVVL